MALLTSSEMEASASLARLRRAGEEVDLIVFKDKTTVMPIGNTPVNVTD